MKRLLPCGSCQTPTTPNLLVEVKVAYHEVQAGQPANIRLGRRWFVCPTCEEPFKRELNMLAALRALAHECGEVPWWRRWPMAASIYTARYHHDLRLKGRPAARREAWRCVCVTIAPDWLAARLVARWRPKPAAPSVPATPAPSLPCGSA